ncbi:MAG: flagellar biosynthesis protein FlhB [Clostridiales bacterium]|jgi:flagellar biosynthetic protein FlhB|nr:flagellar biosynthesis protein FlhB [Clostridiales bacterium]
MADELKLRLRYNLAFFADDPGGEEKTEQPTQRKRDKARGEGQVLKSQEVGTAFLFLTVFFALKIFGSWIYERVAALFQHNIVRVAEFQDDFQDDFIHKYLIYMFGQTILIAAPLLAVALVAGVAVNVRQAGWHPTTKPLQPKLSKLNPVSGFKRMFSLGKALEIPKSLAKIGIIGSAIYAMLKSETSMLLKFVDMGVAQSMIYVFNLMINLGLRVGFMYIFIAIADYAYQKYQHTKSLKMTKQEVKEEYKMTEGDPHIKGKIRQKMREASMRRMMQEVPSADVIITNPTHYAVAVKYDKSKAAAPIVTAKGVDFLARKIKEKAKENNVEIVENKRLARALYSAVEIGREIPAELYQAVAEVLAFVYKLRSKAG